MKLENQLSKIVALTKAIRLKAPKDVEGYRSQFTATINSPIGKCGFSWWYTKSAFRIEEELAAMLVDHDELFQHLGEDDIKRNITNILQDNALNSNLFDFKLLTAGAKSPFDARATKDVNKFALDLMELLCCSLKKLINNALVLYPLSRIVSPSFDLGHDGISLLKADDNKKWQQVSSRYFYAEYWDPATGIDKRRKNFPSLGTFPTWLMCETKGSFNHVREIAAENMRTFLALLFAHSNLSIHQLMTKTDARVNNYAIQFPGCGMGAIGELQPSFPLDINVSSKMLSDIQKWYSLRDSAQPTLKSRSLTGAHFISRAINSQGTESYLFFYIALDSLFGVRGKVKKTIEEGIKTTVKGDQKWILKGASLFDLRSELMHGGCRSIRSWKGLRNYKKHFFSDPLYDVGLISMTALKNYFK